MKLLWMYSMNDSRLFNHIIELSNLTFIRNPDVEQCIFFNGQTDIQLETFFSNSIKIVYNNNLKLNKTLEVFNPDKIILLGDLTNIMMYIDQLNELGSEKKRIAYVSIERPFCKKVFLKKVYKNVDKMIVTSKYIKENTEKILGNSIDYIPIGITKLKSYSKNDAREIIAKHGLDLRGKFVVFNGNANSKHRRMDITMKAFTTFYKKEPKDTVFLFTCSSNSQTGWNLEEMATMELGTKHDCIKFIQIKDTNLFNILLSSCDVGVHTNDGIDVPILAAQHAMLGVPQILGNFGGYKDYFNAENATMLDYIDEYSYPNHAGSIGGEGYIVGVDDVARALLKYYKNPSLRKEYGEKFKHKEDWDEIYKLFYTYVLTENIKEEAITNENTVLRHVS